MEIKNSNLPVRPTTWNAPYQPQAWARLKKHQKETTPTRMAWFPIAVYGKTHNHSVVRVKATKLKDLRNFYDRNKKYDGLDTKTLTMLPIIDPDGIQEVYLAPALVFAL